MVSNKEGHFSRLCILSQSKSSINEKSLWYHLPGEITALTENRASHRSKYLCLCEVKRGHLWQLTPCHTRGWGKTQHETLSRNKSIANIFKNFSKWQTATILSMCHVTSTHTMLVSWVGCRGTGKQDFEHQLSVTPKARTLVKDGCQMLYFCYTWIILLICFFGICV